MRHREAISKTFSDSYYTVTESLLPFTIGTVYSFTGGVALTTSITAVIAQYLSYFAFTTSLAFTGPLSIVVGFSFAYLTYQDNCNKSKAMEILKQEIKDLNAENVLIEQRLFAYFYDDSEMVKKIKEELSFRAGRMICAKPKFLDKRSLFNWIIDLALRFIADAGLTVGTSAFVLTTFTSIGLIGTPLTVIIVAGIAMACLTYFAVHRKWFRHSKEMEVYAAEKERLIHIKNFYNTWLLSNSVPEYKDKTATNLWWDEDKLTHGFYDEILIDIRKAVNRYLVQCELINLDETGYKITSGHITTLDDKFWKRVDEQAGLSNRNVILAIKIALLIEHFGKQEENYSALVYTISKLRSAARSYSLMSWVSQGRSRLADAIDEILDRANENITENINNPNPLNQVKVDEFEKFLEGYFSKYSQLQSYSRKITLTV